MREHLVIFPAVSGGHGNEISTLARSEMDAALACRFQLSSRLTSAHPGVDGNANGEICFEKLGGLKIFLSPVPYTKHSDPKRGNTPSMSIIQTHLPTIILHCLLGFFTGTASPMLESVLLSAVYS